MHPSRKHTHTDTHNTTQVTKMTHIQTRKNARAPTTRHPANIYVRISPNSIPLLCVQLVHSSSGALKVYLRYDVARS